jgi:molybdopterin-guanine dinucleotide biosynthesis protein A
VYEMNDMGSKRVKDVRPWLEGITGVILAGGKSTRYGTNKALAELHGIRLIDRVVHVMASLFEHLVLVTNTPHEYSYLGLPMVEDIIKGLGPIGGIHSGLEAISDETGFFVACDMPYLNENLLRHMVSLKGDFDAVIPRVGGWMVEPLHAVYTKKCLPAIRDSFDSRVYQVMRFFQKIRVRYVDEEEMRSFDPQLMSFFNINKPEDLVGLD